MANKKSSKISIRPIGNAQAIASTLGFGETKPEQEAPQAKSAGEKQSKANSEDTTETATAVTHNQAAKPKKSKLKKENGLSASQEIKSNPEPKKASAETMSLPLMFEIKRKLPGKELFVLSLLYKQKNERGMLQTTVNELMSLYYSVFDDSIKDDTVRRSLKRLADASLIKTKSIPGHNSGYVYEVGDLLETDVFKTEEKEEFSALVSFVESKLNSAR